MPPRPTPRFAVPEVDDTPAPAFRTRDTSRPHRMTCDIDPETYRALRQLSIDHGITANGLLYALLRQALEQENGRTLKAALKEAGDRRRR